MRLPWVSRAGLETTARVAADAAHDAAFHRARADTAERELAKATEREVRADAHAREWERIAMTLFDRVLPVPSSPVTATPVREPRTPDVVQQAIRDEAAGDSRLAGHLRKRANELKAEGKNPEEIAQELRTWQTTADEGLS